VRNPISLVTSIALSCALCACSPAQNAQPISAQSTSTASISVRSFSGDWNETRARDIAIEASRAWQFSDAKDFHGTPAVDLQRTAYSVLPFDHAGEPSWLVLVAVIPPKQTCRACAPVTGGVIFTRKGVAWQAGYDQSHIVSIGANGQPPKVRVQNLGPALPAVAFEMVSMAQGLEATTLTLVADVQGQLREVLSLETEESNQAAGLPETETYKWQANVERSSSSQAEFPDIIVKFSGTKPAEDGQKARPYTTTSVYRFSGGVYRLAP
jgi:hypothetical protein